MEEKGCLVIGILLLGIGVVLAVLNMIRLLNWPTIVPVFFAALGTGIIKYAFAKRRP